MEQEMTTFTVKNIPTDIYNLLKRSAEMNRRSINSEILMCIEKAVSSYKVDVDTMLKQARSLRELTQNHRFSDEEILQAKNEGRA